MLEAVLNGLGRMEALDVPVHLPEEPAPDQGHPVVVSLPEDIRSFPQQLPALVEVPLHLLPLEQVFDSRVRPVCIVPGRLLKRLVPPN